MVVQACVVAPAGDGDGGGDGGDGGGAPDSPAPLRDAEAENRGRNTAETRGGNGGENHGRSGDENRGEIGDKTGPLHRFRIGGVWYRRSVILTPESVTLWEVGAVAELTVAHFERLADLGAEVIILGSGARAAAVPVAITQPLMRRRIGLEIMNNPPPAAPTTSSPPTAAPPPRP